MVQRDPREALREWVESLRRVLGADRDVYVSSSQRRTAFDDVALGWSRCAVSEVDRQRPEGRSYSIRTDAALVFADCLNALAWIGVRPEHAFDVAWCQERTRVG